MADYKNNSQRDLQCIRQYLETQDEAILRELLDRYVQLGYTIIHRIVQQREEAEDVLQEALIKVIHGLPQFKGISSFKTWFCKICYHEGINRYKKAKSHPSVSIEDLEVELHEKSSLEQEVEKKLEQEKIWSCVEELNPRYRSVLMAFYHDELSIKEIARMMDMNENTVKTHLSRAKNELKDKLKNYTFT